MHALVKLGNRLLESARTLAWLPPLLARVTVGWVFVISGWGKLHHLDKVAGFFMDIGLPAPDLLARVVACTEFAGGLLLIAGLATRIASVALGVIMIVALRTALALNIHGFSDLVGVIEYAYLVLLVWLAVAGPGAAAVDALIARKYRGRE